ncbi:MAG TPA: DNA methyltransferase, partial [Candidatus Binatia bacterium]|nr:DNA methyltransferase [Candidatus Binatia bacterium]
MEIRYIPIGALKARSRNPRTHSEKQIGQITESVDRFGFTTPILIDADQTVIAGHGRIEAAKRLGMTELPTIRLDHMTEAEIRAYVIADNKLAELAGWDDELLAAEFQYLADLDLEFDLTVTGFETPEIDLLINLGQSSEPDEADEIPAIDPDRPAVTRTGDLWHLGRHALLCADATKAESFGRLLGRKKAQTVFIDPPYNVPISGHVCGMGRVKHREFAMASGEMSAAEYASFLAETFRHLSAFSADGSIHFVCIDWRHVADVISNAKGFYSELKNICVWTKDNGGMGSLYRSQHELICVFKNGTAPHINNVDLGRYGRYRTNVWHYPGVNTLREGRMDDLAMHPTVKPTQLVADAILDCSKRGAAVLDCFGGSGTTLIAAEKAGRRGFLIEIDPVYVDVTIERFSKLTGTDGVHAETGRTFTEMRAERISALTTGESAGLGEEG